MPSAAVRECWVRRGLKDPGFDGGSIFLGIGVDLPGCSFCCGSSIAANSAGAQEWSRWSARSPRCLRARTNDLDQTEHRRMIGGGETAASDISGRQVLGGVVGGLELHRWNVSDRSVE